MITIMLATAHAFSTNSNFQPILLYFGTFLIDIELVGALAKCLM